VLPCSAAGVEQAAELLDAHTPCTHSLHTPLHVQGFSLKSLKHLVLDEADKLLDMDFEQEIDQVGSQVVAWRGEVCGLGGDGGDVRGLGVKCMGRGKTELAHGLGVRQTGVDKVLGVDHSSLICAAMACHSAVPRYNSKRLGCSKRTPFHHILDAFALTLA